MAKRPQVTWSRVYPRLPFGYAEGVERLIKQPKFVKDLAGIMTRASSAMSSLRWNDVQAIADRYLTTAQHVSLAALHQYGVMLVQHGDYVETTDIAPSWLERSIAKNPADSRGGSVSRVSNPRNY